MSFVPLRPNRILMTDSYKLSHQPDTYQAGISGIFSYGEARTKNDQIVFFGLQAFLLKYWSTPLEVWEIDEAEAFAAAHGEPFDRSQWEKIMTVYNGYPPVMIRALPEGTVTRSGIPLYSIEVTDPDLINLGQYLETQLIRAVWYPTTIASNDLKNYRIIRRYLEESSDTKDSLPFMLHDFGGRGVSSSETAEVGGMAHMVYFTGSDTIEGIRAANHYYQCPMAAWSVAASEHSIQTSYGKLGQVAYLNKMIDKYAKQGAILSIVIDGYDTMREAKLLCSEPLKSKIIASGAKVVFRPDSGDPLEIIPKLLEMQAESYGFTVNSKGYKVIKTVGLLQGDGIDMKSMEAILETITQLGYSAQNIVFGSGGGLLQKVNRDTYAFAQKASAVLHVGQLGGSEWHGIKKDPVTDPGKTSKMGRITAIRQKTGDWGYAPVGELPEGAKDAFENVWFAGQWLKPLTTLEQVRSRAKEPIYKPTV